jgi:hypothetical protein
MFSRPTDAERERLPDDLLHRAELVRTRGWNDYRAVWSTGEVVGVVASSATTTYLASSARLCNPCGLGGHSICGALPTARPMSTTTVNRPAGGSWRRQGRSKAPRDARSEMPTALRLNREMRCLPDSMRNLPTVTRPDSLQIHWGTAK